MTKKLSAKIKELPQKPGVYLFKDADGRILYIGKALNLKNRVRSHFSKNGDAYGDNLIKNTADIDSITTANAKEALILENELIKKYLPKYNIQWRDDKSYFWVLFSDDEWPRVQIAHKRQALNAKRQLSGIGPFVNNTELKKILRALRKILPYRACKNPYDKPCLQWHLGLCPAHSGQSPVANRKSPQIANSQSLKNSPQPPFAKRRGAVFFQKTAQEDLLKIYHLSLNTLRQFLRLYAEEPIQIEAYDISNIHGAHSTGSMVVFTGNKPKKSNYRRFRIKTVRGANDTAMLKEVLRRRLNHSEWPLPDLILIDGGRGQLNAVRHTANSQWPLVVNKLKSSAPHAINPKPLTIIALAKKEEELYTEYSDKILHLNSLPPILRLTFQIIRDEAHRFAISYYRHLHGKKFKRRATPKKTGN